jgi:hypothetical protein
MSSSVGKGDTRSDDRLAFGLAKRQTLRTMWVRRWLQRRENRKDSVTLWLLRDEALVLDAVFTRYRDENKPLEPTDEAERTALAALGAEIEVALSDDVLGDSYTESLAGARERLLRREQG